MFYLPLTSHRRRLYVTLIILISVLSAGLTGQARDAPPPPDELISLSAGQPKNPRLDTTLITLAKAAHHGRAAIQESADRQSIALIRERVQVQLVAREGALSQARAAVMSVEGEITGTVEDMGWLQCWIPVTALETLADHSAVSYMHVPERARPQTLDTQTGQVVSEALKAMNVPLWHGTGYIGQGTKVGIIDIGFGGYPAFLGSELPPQILTRNFVDGEAPEDIAQGSNHSTAVAEILHDIAPGASLYFAKIDTVIDLIQAVDWLVNDQGVDVIHTSINWYTQTPGDGTGFLADLITDVRDHGVIWITSAGNERERHWSGDWAGSSAGFLEFSNVNVINYLQFGPDNSVDPFLIPSGVELEILVRWSDWDEVEQDYDVCLISLYDGLVNNLICSQNDQSGNAGQTPTERIVWTTEGVPTYYGIRIQEYETSRQDVHFDVFAFGVTALQHNVPSQSLSNLADAPDAITVAAAHSLVPFGQQPYSSEGPTKGLGGVGEEGLPKPNLIGYDQVTTSSNGLFAGTSAAAAHTSGAVALIVSAYPDWGPDEIEGFLYDRALPHGEPGWNPICGHGRLYLGSSPKQEILRWAPLIMR